MPILLVLGVGYAVNAARIYAENREKRSKENPEKFAKLKLQGRTASITMMPSECEMSIMELPIATVTFYKGSFEDAANHLEKRVEKIVRANPYLSGCLMEETTKDKKSHLKLFYDKKGEFINPNHFQLFKKGSVHLHPGETPYTEYGKILDDAGAVVLRTFDMIGMADFTSQSCLWKVALIPLDSSRSYPNEESFALVVSMSHMIGDAHTYYKLYNMLSTVCPIEQLRPERLEPNYSKAVVSKLGDQQANYVQRTLQTSEDEAKDGNDPKQAKSTDDQNKTGESIVSFEINNPLFKSESELGDNEKIKMVVKVFYINEDFVLKQQIKQKKSAIEDGEDAEDEALSDLDLRRISSLFDPDNMAKDTFLSLDQMELLDKIAEKVEQEEADENRRRFTVNPVTLKDDILSANSVISSWFFKVNHADLGFCMANLRNRLSEHGCNVNDMDCGNYVSATIFTPEDYETAELIQESTNALNTPSRAMSSSKLPKFSAGTTMSMSINWANFYRDEIEICDTVSQVLHFPLYACDALNKALNGFSAINIFTASHPGSNKRRAGAFVLCSEKVWLEEIRDCGIVDEMLAET